MAFDTIGQLVIAAISGGVITQIINLLANHSLNQANAEKIAAEADLMEQRLRAGYIKEIADLRGEVARLRGEITSIRLELLEAQRRLKDCEEFKQSPIAPGNQ